MPAEFNDLCTKKDLDPEGTNVRFWGNQSPCTKFHAGPSASQIILSFVYWVRLGRDTEARPCREWLGPNVIEGPHQPSCASWPVFLKCIGCTENEILRDKYVMKFPGIIDAIPIESQEQLDNTLRSLTRYMGSTPNYWCQAPPPVLLICTADQAARCEKREWIDCVWREAAIFYRDAATAERNMCASQVAGLASSAIKTALIPAPSFRWVTEGGQMMVEVSFELPKGGTSNQVAENSQIPPARAVITESQPARMRSTPVDFSFID